MSNIGKVETASITREMERSYLDYAMSVIVARALPDVRDGLKPVHRRILYAMKRLNLTYSARFSKSAKIVGEVLGKYHPHGDMPVYDALVRLAQEFSMRYPLIKGQGNFGSIDGDPPAAMRYTEVKLERIANEMLADIDKETVPFSENFDRSLLEPDFLPSRLPNLLLMGAEGIAVGMATKIPPHNLGEIISALVLMIDKSRVSKELDDYKLEIDVNLDDLMKFIKGPDFPTSGIIFDQKTIKEAYASGRASIIMRGVANIEDVDSGKKAIIVSQLPYQVNKANLVTQIATLVKNKRLEGVSALRDESDRHGIRLYIELKRNTRPKAILNNLFKLTPLQTSFPVNMVALVRGTPQTLSLKSILTEYLRHRLIVITKRSQFELKQAKARAHILEGLKIALDNLDAVIKTIKQSKTAETAKTNLMAKFKLSEAQASAILDLQLRRLAALERQKIEDEYQLMLETISYLEDLLAHPVKIMTIIKEELKYLEEKYADERRTRVVKGKVGEFKEADLVPNSEMVICLTRSGYIKSMERQLFKTQLRGGKGVSAMTTKETDVIDHIIIANNHDQILFFSNLGKVYQLRVFEIPKVSRSAKGMAVINLIGIESNEQIQSVLTYPADDKNTAGQFIILATKKGLVKKTALAKFANIRSNGLIAIKLDKDDTLRWARLTSGCDQILLVSKTGQAIVFNEKQVRTTGRDTRGVSGQKLRPKDSLVCLQSFSASTVKEQKLNLLVITANGLGKRTLLSEFRTQNRGGFGVKAAKINAKTGPLVACFIVDPHKVNQVIITSSRAQTIKVELKNIPQLQRSTQGVILIRFAKSGDTVADAAPLLK